MSGVDRSCCPPNSHPFLAEDPNYVPKGEFVEYEGIDAYKVGTGSRAIIYIHDIFGLRSGRNMLLCDTFSEQLPDTVVIAPNFYVGGNLFNKDPPNTLCSLLPKFCWAFFCCKICGFFKKNSWDNGAGRIFDETTRYLIAKMGVQCFIPIGFCWGAYVGFKACGAALDKDKIVGNISCHPSVSGVASMISEDENAIVDAVNCAQLIASTGSEPAAWKPEGAVTKKLAAREFGSQCEFYLYGQQHGFVPRGDTKVEATRVAIEDCVSKIVAFVKKVSPS